jgi:hypothetical protein
MPNLGLSLNIQSGVVLKKVQAFDADYQAVLNRATALSYGLPSASVQTKQNQLVINLKAANIWSSLDCFQMYANDSAGTPFSMLNWKNPSGNLGVISGSNLTFNKYGFLGGASSFINTGYNPAPTPTGNGVNLSVNNASYGVWKYQNDNTAGKYMCGNSVGNNYIIGESGISYNSRIFTTAGLSAGINNQSTGLLFISRAGASGAANNTVWSVNGTNTNFTPAGTVSVASANFAVFTYNVTTGSAAAYLGGISMFFAGSNLSAKSSDFTTAMTTYINSL